MKFDYSLLAPNQWAGVTVEIHGLPDANGASVAEDVSGFKTLSLAVYATGIPIMRLEAISGERGRDMSMTYPQMTFKVLPGMNTYKVPLTGFAQPAWVTDRRSGPEGHLQEADFDQPVGVLRSVRAEQARHGDSRQRDIREVGINHHDAPTSSHPAVALLLQDFTFEGKRWWTHIEFLAGDALEGRNVGTPGFEKAVAYVETQFQDIGLKPGGASGYRQPVELESRELVPAQTKLALVRNGVEEPLTLREDATLNARSALSQHHRRADGVRRLRPVDSRRVGRPCGTRSARESGRVRERPHPRTCRTT